MRKTGFSHNNGIVKEVMPKSMQLQSDRSRRNLFFSMINAMLSRPNRFGPDEYHPCRRNVYEIMRHKILHAHGLLPWSTHQLFIARRCGFSVDVGATQRLGLFCARHKHCIPHYLHVAAATVTHPSTISSTELIDLMNDHFMIRDDTHYTMFDLDALFANFVYQRTKRTNKHKRVELHDNTIAVFGDREHTLVIPQWRRVDTARLDQVRDAIDGAFATIGSGTFSQVYLVYPKNPGLLRHLEIRKPDQAATQRVKIIPYSFSFCNRTRRKSAR